MMLDVRDSVAWLATVCTVALFSTGIPICLKIVKNGSTGDSLFFPFIAMFCNGTLWFKYGLLKGDPIVIYVNLAGAVLSFFYITVFYRYSIQKGSVHKQLLFGSVMLFPILLYVKFYATFQESALFYLGCVCALSSFFLYGAPLSAMRDVMRTKSTECLAFPMCFANFVVALEWLMYGYIIEDLFIQVPNSLGTVLAMIQLSLFVKYPHKRSHTDLS